MRKVVVLPQPDGPSIEKNSPPGMSRLMLSTARNGPKRLLRSMSWMVPSVLWFIPWVPRVWASAVN
jgi:hypothetical protein